MRPYFLKYKLLKLDKQAILNNFDNKGNEELYKFTF